MNLRFGASGMPHGESGGRTKFHDPKNRNPRELDPNATGERVASNQVNEDSTGGEVSLTTKRIRDVRLEHIAACRYGLTRGRYTEGQTLPER